MSSGAQHVSAVIKQCAHVNVTSTLNSQRPCLFTFVCDDHLYLRSMSDATNAPDLAWKKLKLSLERPYKDDLGNAIPVLYDLTPEGERIYEPYDCQYIRYNDSDFSQSKESSSSRLETNLRRIIIERGLDYFEKRENPNTTVEVLGTDGDKSPSNEVDDIPKPMTVEELNAMRMEIMPHLL